MKKKCALYASKLVKDGMVVGLGGGSTISYLVDYVKDKDIKVVSPSSKTVLLAQKAGLTVLNTQYVDHVDIAFVVFIHKKRSLRLWPMSILYWWMKLNFMIL